MSRLLLIVLLTGLLAACGFKLRGQQDFPFETISVPQVSPLGIELRRNSADAVLTVLAEQQEKVILSLNTQGRVREFQLRYRVAYRVSSPKGLDFVPPTAVVLTRDITFNDQVLAKETEEAQLYAEMRSDMVQAIIGGNSYCNVHSTVNGGGEIRGQFSLSR